VIDHNIATNLGYSSRSNYAVGHIVLRSYYAATANALGSRLAERFLRAAAGAQCCRLCCPPRPRTVQDGNALSGETPLSGL